MNKTPRIAIVADWMTSRGGAERVVSALIDLYPKADIITSVYNPTLFPEYKDRVVKTTWLQKLPQKIRNRHQILLAFFPSAFKAVDTKPYDLIISSSSAFAKCVRVHKHQKHICYCHTPTRYLYHAKDEYINTYPVPWFLKPFKWVLPMLLGYLEKQDYKAAQQVTHFLANSNYVGERIKKYYHRDATTIYPCIETKSFAPTNTEKDDYFLAIGRFIPYKKFDLLVETFVNNGLPLKLAGKGPELERCKQIAKGHSNIEFLGFVKDEDLPPLYSNARAFVFPAEEDFGLTPVESMASGTPVIYYAKGGATESVGQYGIGFSKQTPESLQEAIHRFLKEEPNISQNTLVNRATEFDQQIFQKHIDKICKNLYNTYE